LFTWPLQQTHIIGLWKLRSLAPYNLHRSCLCGVINYIFVVGVAKPRMLIFCRYLELPGDLCVLCQRTSAHLYSHVKPVCSLCFSSVCSRYRNGTSVSWLRNYVSSSLRVLISQIWFSIKELGGVHLRLKLFCRGVLGFVNLSVIFVALIIRETHCSEMVEALCYKPEGRGFETRWSEFFSIYLILAAALDLSVYSASNTNYYQKKKITFLGSRTRPVRRGDSLATICKPIV
jgi:hypothetical protein